MTGSDIISREIGHLKSSGNWFAIFETLFVLCVIKVPISISISVFLYT